MQISTNITSFDSGLPAKRTLEGELIAKSQSVRTNSNYVSQKYSDKKVESYYEYVSAKTIKHKIDIYI